jgi:hypothetical protein
MIDLFLSLAAMAISIVTLVLSIQDAIKLHRLEKAFPTWKETR